MQNTMGESPRCSKKTFINKGTKGSGDLQNRKKEEERGYIGGRLITIATGHNKHNKQEKITKHQAKL
jgi:hypothetical protein